MAKERTFSGETHAGDAPILPARLAKQNTTRGFRNIIKFNTLISCGCPNSEASNLIKFSTLILCECPNSEASNLIKLSTLILCECPNSEASNLIKFSTLILHVCECPNGETSNLIKFSTLILSECPNSEANCLVSVSDSREYCRSCLRSWGGGLQGPLTCKRFPLSHEPLWHAVPDAPFSSPRRWRLSPRSQWSPKMSTKRINYTTFQYIKV